MLKTVHVDNAKHRVFIQLARFVRIKRLFCQQKSNDRIHCSVESFCKTIQFVFIFCIILTPSHAYQQKNPYEKTSILSHWLGKEFLLFR